MNVGREKTPPRPARTATGAATNGWPATSATVPGSAGKPGRLGSMPEGREQADSDGPDEASKSVTTPIDEAIVGTDEPRNSRAD